MITLCARSSVVIAGRVRPGGCCTDTSRHVPSHVSVLVANLKPCCADASGTTPPNTTSPQLSGSFVIAAHRRNGVTVEAWSADARWQGRPATGRAAGAWQAANNRPQQAVALSQPLWDMATWMQHRLGQENAIVCPQDGDLDVCGIYPWRVRSLGSGVPNTWNRGFQLAVIVCVRRRTAYIGYS